MADHEPCCHWWSFRTVSDNRETVFESAKSVNHNRDSGTHAVISDTDSSLYHEPTKPPAPAPPMTGKSSGSLEPTRVNPSYDEPPPQKVYKISDLAKSTQNFSDRLLLGQGGFGKVFRGSLRDPTTGQVTLCAIKRLNPESIQGQQEWLTEIQVLSRLHHQYLVQLYGYCTDDGEGLLVYEYVPLGSLDYHLFDLQEGQAPLSWEQRLRIAYQSAQALSFLHDKGVIHRDFKAPNVLLDQDKNVKLTDFGLAKLADADKSHVSTRIMGTMGYLDPKYMETGQLTKASDVFSYGVLLLELLTGRQAVQPNNPEASALSVWSHQFFSKRNRDVSEYIDPLILPEVNNNRGKRLAKKLAVTAKHCVEDVPQSRPLMKDVVETLKSLMEAYNERYEGRD